MFGDVTLDFGLGFLTVLVSFEGLSKENTSLLSDTRVIKRTIDLITLDMILTGVDTGFNIFDKEKHLVSDKTGVKSSLREGEIVVFPTLVVRTNRIALTITLHHNSIVISFRIHSKI